MIEDAKRHTCRGLFPCPLLYEKGQEFPRNVMRGLVLDKFKKQLISWAQNDDVINLWDYQTGSIIA